MKKKTKEEKETNEETKVEEEQRRLGRNGEDRLGEKENEKRN